MLKEINYITNNQLLENFVSSSLEEYFYRKLKNEEKSYVRLKICELLKFLLLSHNTTGNIPFNDEIDEIWHLWILQTIQYQELMDKLPSRRFIHHCSNDYVDKDNIKPDYSYHQETERQFSYLVSYIINFGDFTSETVKFWPMLGNLISLLELNLEEINNYLKDNHIKHTP